MFGDAKITPKYTPEEVSDFLADATGILEAHDFNPVDMDATLAQLVALIAARQVTLAPYSLSTSRYVQR